MAASYPGIPGRYAAPLHAPSMAYYNQTAEHPQMYGALSGLYADAEGKPGAEPPLPGYRKRMNALSLALALFAPWLLFCTVLAVLSSYIHYENPQLAYLTSGGCFLIVGSWAVGAVISAKQRELSRHPPSWYFFLFITGLVAWGSAVVLGDLNFFQNMVPYFDVMNLNSYDGVNPATTPGQKLMDGGKIKFLRNARVDLRRSMSFKNLDTYCVAPITVVDANGTAAMPASYDFWAVGLNCCDGDGSNFQCGDVHIHAAHAGLRMTRDEQRPFYRLAVQQAMAAHGLKATHPLFVYWVRDPVVHMWSYKEEGYKYIFLGFCAHFLVQLCLVLAAAVTFAGVVW